uniref:GRAM domain-containing protein n=1 Tax=Glossina palpalis gambiensis TaxID=67801 RepID=A0A1B0BFW0_9MUSC
MYGGIGTVMCVTQKFYAESTNSVTDSSFTGSTEAAAAIPLPFSRNSLHCQRKVLIKARIYICHKTNSTFGALSLENETSTSSVSTIEQNFPNSTIVATTTPITSLHNHAGTQSVLCLSAFEKDLRIQPVHKPQQSHQHRNKRLFQQQLSTPIEGVITNSPASASGAGDYSSASYQILSLVLGVLWEIEKKGKMVYDSLTSLVESAKSVFQPRNDNDIKSFENYIFNNYITDMELDEEDEEEEEEEDEENNADENENVNENKNENDARLRNDDHAKNKGKPIGPTIKRREISIAGTGHLLADKRGRKLLGSKKLKRVSMVELPQTHRDCEFSTNLQRFSSMQSLKHNNNSTRLGQLVNVPSEVSLRSISPSRRSASSNSSSTAKHEHSSTAATAATGSSAAAAVSTSSSTTPPEKEKKRKEVSSSRVKKFHRHFSQVSKDEKLINYFSCALVSDILLQGHLYITDKHFAFYSNVFGYVTKVVIPTSSVTKISKEKTAKIIPNAVGVATADERHVFGSFISREAAFRLMCSVCPPLAPAVALLPKDPASIEISEEYSIEDDSSCSVSGNESPAQTNENGCNVNSMAAHKDSSQTLLRHTITNSNLSIVESSAQQRHSDIPLNAKTAVFSASSANLHTHIAGSRISAPIVANLAKTTSNVGGGVGSSASNKNKSSLTFSQPTACTASLTVLPSSSTAEANVTFIAGTASTTTSATSTPTPSTSSSPTTVQAKPSTSIQKALQTLRTFTKTTMLRIRYPRELHVVYMGVMLTLVLTVFTIFLLYRILDIEAKTSIYRLPNEFNWRSGNDDDIFAEALRFQNELEHKSTEEAQNILRANLEQIAKVRRSLETLSMLIHDRGSTFDSHHHYVNRDDSN